MSYLEDEYYVLEIDRICEAYFTNDRLPNDKIELDDNPVALFYHNSEGFGLTGPLMIGSGRYLISKSIFKSINKFVHNGVQLLPVIVDDGEERCNYYVVNFYKEMPWIDLEKSVYEDSDLTLHGVEKLVLKKELVESVPKEDRMIFSPEECPDLLICHKEVVESIFTFYRDIYDDKPDGIKFTKLSEFTKE